MPNIVFMFVVKIVVNVSHDCWRAVLGVENQGSGTCRPRTLNLGCVYDSPRGRGVERTHVPAGKSIQVWLSSQVLSSSDGNQRVSDTHER